MPERVRLDIECVNVQREKSHVKKTISRLGGTTVVVVRRYNIQGSPLLRADQITGFRFLPVMVRPMPGAFRSRAVLESLFCNAEVSIK